MRDIERIHNIVWCHLEHIVEKHSNVGGGHCGGTCSRIVGFRSGHGDGGRHGRIGCRLV